VAGGSRSPANSAEPGDCHPGLVLPRPPGADVGSIVRSTALPPATVHRLLAELVGGRAGALRPWHLPSGPATVAARSTRAGSRRLRDAPFPTSRTSMKRHIRLHLGHYDAILRSRAESSRRTDSCRRAPQGGTPDVSLHRGPRGREGRVTETAATRRECSELPQSQAHSVGRHGLSAPASQPTNSASKRCTVAGGSAGRSNDRPQRLLRAVVENRVQDGIARPQHCLARLLLPPATAYFTPRRNRDVLRRGNRAPRRSRSTRPIKNCDRDQIAGLVSRARPRRGSAVRAGQRAEEQPPAIAVPTAVPTRTPVSYTPAATPAVARVISVRVSVWFAR